MIQDIGSCRFDIAFSDRNPGKDDYVLRFSGDGRILVGSEADRLLFPKGNSEAKPGGAVYLFSLDETRFFLLLQDEENALPGFSFRSIRDLRGTCINADILVVFTAYHLWRWYHDNHYCGRCAGRMKPGTGERSLVCGSCGNIVYPRINPAVIVGVIKGDALLITRYNRGYAHNALIAGFTEIGETLEQTVSREVMEEAGIRVKNIRYYKSQPWGMAQDVLMGFFCEADGNDKIRMDANELKSAEWVRREDIELQPNNLSLTNEMMSLFKEGLEGTCTIRRDTISEESSGVTETGTSG